MPWSATSIAGLVLAAGVVAGSPMPAAASVKAAVGVCLRWGAAPDRVEDVVVVQPSGNPTLDTVIADSIRQMHWPRPADPAKAREWVGVWMSVGGAPIPPGPLPSCENADRLLSQPRLDATAI